jgi:putative transposase
MKTTKFNESQIVGILKQQEQGKKVADICRENGISVFASGGGSVSS